MENKQNILIVHNYYQLSGGEDTVVANEKKMLEDNGHKVFLYSRNNNELKKMSIFRKLLLPFTTIYNPKTARDIKRIIQRDNIDIVYVHNTLNLVSPSVYYAARRMKKPVIQTIHNFRLLCPGATFYRDGHICEDCVSKGLKCALKHKCYRNSYLQTFICVLSTSIHRMIGIYGKINYICLTEFNKNKLLSYKKIESKQIFVKPNFVENTSEQISAEKRKNQFVFVGRLDKLKGVDILLNAWRDMGINAPKLVLCGTGPMENWCRDFIKENSLNVDMMGFVQNEIAKKIIGESRALILPTQWYEGFPMTIVEAFSMGTPVICTDIGNCGCIVENGISGIKFKENGLKNAIIECKGMFDTTYKLYTKKYTKDINYKILKRIMEQLL